MTENEWTKKAKSKLVGKKIAGVRWMTRDEATQSGWHNRPIVLVLDDGTWVAPMSDDEGNDGGALAHGNDTWPVMWQ